MTQTTTTRLADGREILYFDDAGSAERPPESLVDHRVLPARAEAGQLRFDALSREWVAVAAHRQQRTHLPPADQCPICPTTPANLTEIPASNYDVAVFENRFPSLGPDTSPIPASPVWGTTAAAVGRCEVVAFTPEHTGSFADLGWRRTRTVIDAWAHRTAALSSLPGIRQVFPFENRGAEIGVTLHHPHGQIYAYPYVTPRAAVLAAAAGEFFDNSGGATTLASSLLRAERSDGSRMVIEGEHFSAYVPFASRWPLEVHLVPHRQVADLAALNGAERDELARALPRTLEALRRPVPDADPLHRGLAPGSAGAGHAAVPVTLHLQLTSPRRAADKLKYLAGSEAAMGAFINDTTPESVAVRLREAAGVGSPATLTPATLTPEGARA